MLLHVGDPRGVVPFQRQQLSVGSKDFGDCVFELPAAHNAWADRVDPVFRDAFDMLLTLDHEGERPNRVALSLGAMTRRLAATPVGQRQGARQAIGRHLETGEELAFSPAQACCSRFLWDGGQRYLSVIIHSDNNEARTIFNVYQGNTGRIVKPAHGRRGSFFPHPGVRHVRRHRIV